MSRTIAILQPSYLPWLGFFAQLWMSDIFVLYDDVQFDKNGWRNRNKIKTSNGIQWLTVPVKVHLGDKISQVPIDNSLNWKKKHLKSIELSYGKAAYFNDFFPRISEVISEDWKLLVDLDAALIRAIADMLGLERKIIFSSEVDVNKEDDKEQRLVEMCKILKADIFYEGAAGRNYIEEDRFARQGITLKYQDYAHPVYNQLHGDFVPYLSIIDLLFNEGKNSLSILTKQDKKVN